MAAAVWNPTAEDQDLVIVRNGKEFSLTVKAERATALEIG